MSNLADHPDRRINAFSVEREYLFSYHFPPDIFEELRPFYNDDEYRFEVPDERMTTVERRLEANHYRLHRIDDVDPYCVVIRKGEEGPPELFRKSILRRSTRFHRVYLLEDRVAVEEAIHHGATTLAESDVDDVF